MRDRLVAAFAGFAALSILLYAVPATLWLVSLVETQERASVERKIVVVAGLIEERRASDREVGEQFLRTTLGPGEELRFVPGDGSAVMEVGDAGTDPTAVTQDLSGGGQITLSRSADVIAERVGQGMVPLLVLALVLLAVAVVAARWLGGRLVRPFQELAAQARQLGTGDFDLDVRTHRVAEAEAIGSALRSSADRLEALLRRERDRTVHASHELRTPLTAISLEVDDLEHRSDLPPEVDDQLRRVRDELGRLGTAVTAMLEPAADPGRVSDVRSVLADVVAELGVGGRLQVGPGPASLVAAEPRQLRNLLVPLVRRAVEEGTGPVRVAVTPSADRVELTLSFDHAGRAADVADARAAAEAVGARLAVDPSPVAGYLVILPTAGEDEVLGRRR